MNPYKVIDTVLDGTTTSVAWGPMPLHLDDFRSLSFINLWNQAAADGQTLDATIKVEISNDPRCHVDARDGTDTADYLDITSSLTITDPTTGAGSGDINVSDGGWAYIRITFTRNSGTGRVTSYFNTQR